MNCLNLIKSVQGSGLIGWLATAVFGASYLCKQPATLRRVQALGAGIWMVYGVAIGALPVIVANIIVAGAALYSAFPPPSRASSSQSSAPEASMSEGSDAAEAAIPFWPY